MSFYRSLGAQDPQSVIISEPWQDVPAMDSEESEDNASWLFISGEFDSSEDPDASDHGSPKGGSSRFPTGLFHQPGRTGSEGGSSSQSLASLDFSHKLEAGPAQHVFFRPSSPAATASRAEAHTSQGQKGSFSPQNASAGQGGPTEPQSLSPKAAAITASEFAQAKPGITAQQKGLQQEDKGDPVSPPAAAVPQGDTRTKGPASSPVKEPTSGNPIVPIPATDQKKPTNAPAIIADHGTAGQGSKDAKEASPGSQAATEKPAPEGTPF